MVEIGQQNNAAEDFQKPVISLSTSYLQRKFAGDGYAMLQEAADMGFEYVELGHSTTMGTMDGIERAVKEGVVKVSSLHNFCPVPPFAKGAAPNLFSPATRNALESRQWRRHTSNTLEFARMFGAKAVVCHCGELSYFFRRPDSKIAAILDEKGYEGLESADGYLKLVEKFKKKAARRSEKRDYKNIAKNISALHETAEEIGVFFGLENREAYPELPLDWNIAAFFEALRDLPRAKFWHDVGHSKRKELARIYTQMELAECTADIVCGWHLHDCSESGKDHIAIGKGCIDFKAISKFFDAKKHIFTLELNRAEERSDAVDSLKRVQDML